MDESLLEVRLEDRFDHFDFQRFDEFSVLLDASDLSRGISFLPPLQRFGVVAADRAEALILTKARMRGRAPESLSSYECVLQVQHDCRQLTAARVQQARACLERAAESDPEYAVAWALLGMSYLGQVRLRTVPRAEDEILLDRALQARSTPQRWPRQRSCATIVAARALLLRRGRVSPGGR